MVTSYEMLPVSQAPCFPFIVSLDPPNIFLVLREVKNVSEDTQQRHSFFLWLGAPTTPGPQGSSPNGGQWGDRPAFRGSWAPVQIPNSLRNTLQKKSSPSHHLVCLKNSGIFPSKSVLVMLEIS